MQAFERDPGFSAWMYRNGITVAFKLRILTYNIHKGYSSGNRRFMLDSMRQRIAETHADIVFLQEIHGKSPKSEKAQKKHPYPEQSQFEYLADQGVRQTNNNLVKYQKQLLRQIGGLSPLCVTNNFNSMIKSRIIMMCQGSIT